MRHPISSSLLASLSWLMASPVVDAAVGDSSALYTVPPDPIPRILSAPASPTVFLSPDREFLALMEREELPPISRLAEPELRLAGTRLNPQSNGRSRLLFGTNLSLVSVATGEKSEVHLPGPMRIADGSWSPDGKHFAFTHTSEKGIELWIVDRQKREARRLTEPVLNSVLEDPYQWDFDSRSIYVRRTVTGRNGAPAAPSVPAGPVIQETLGVAGPVRTYQDLLANPHDEQLFDFYFSSEWIRVDLQSGGATPILPAGIWSGLSVSPDGNYLLVTRYKRPYSYLAPMFAFPREIDVVDRTGKRVHRIEDRTRVTLPRIGRDMVNPGPRDIHWRPDVPATLVWAVVADGGDAKAKAEVRDRVFLLNAPFAEAPVTLVDLDQRFVSALWSRGHGALIRSAWLTTSRTKTRWIHPEKPDATARVIFDRSYEDRYADPGTPITEPTGNGHRVLHFDASGLSIFLAGEGASPKGNYPFLDRLDLQSGKSNRLWRAADPYLESVVALIDRNGGRFITKRESATEPPNYFIRDLDGDESKRLTNFPDPAPELAGLQRQIITYPRKDGILLSATLITPPGYQATRDGPLPMLFWAYPREFRDAAAAGQVDDSPNRFSRPSGPSHLFLLTQGYAILDGPAMPIIGEGDVEPNDTYVEQLVSSAQAAVDKVVALGVARRDQIGVGGHSYGAFMTANLIAHSDLFRCGIARSGAYNRTLTPFGFQAEPRSFWEAEKVYLEMSPFTHANKINEPLLFIHGQADDNPGTFPLQSERMYQAVAGHGGAARLVMLPHEAHAYLAKESVLHVLAEMVRWMDRHVKGNEKAKRNGN